MSIATDILPFIPQRDPFVMIATLEECSETSAVSSFEVLAENIFVEDGILKEPALIENIAQTAAARMGYICLQEKKEVPVGFIGAVQDLVIEALPKTGDVLTTTVTIKHHIFNATIIEGVIHISEKKIASCNMKIFTENEA